MTGSNFTSWYNQGEGTILFSYVQFITNNSRLLGQLSDGTSNNRIGIQNLDGTTPRWFQVASGSSEGSAEGVAQSAGTIVKHAIGMKLNDFRAAYNGTLTTADTSITLPSMTRLDIAGRETLVQAEIYGGSIQRIAYYPIRVTNANLQALTS
jgi:hypothetical protein